MTLTSPMWNHSHQKRKKKHLAFISERWVCWNIKRPTIDTPSAEESVVEAPQCLGRFITGRFVPHSEIWVSSAAWKLHCFISRPPVQERGAIISSKSLRSVQQSQQLFVRRRSNPAFTMRCLPETWWEKKKKKRINPKLTINNQPLRQLAHADIVKKPFKKMPTS